MKKQLFKTIASSALLLSAAGIAQADDDVYHSLFVGYSVGETLEAGYSYDYGSGLTASYSYEIDDNESGYALGYILGKNINDNFRAESNFAYSTTDAELKSGSSKLSFETTTISAMANVWYDFLTGSVTPYVGFGAGVEYIDAELKSSGGGPKTDGSEFLIATEIGLGVRFDATEKLVLDVGYRERYRYDDIDLDTPSGAPSALDFIGNNEKSKQLVFSITGLF